MAGFWYLATPFSRHPGGFDVAAAEAAEAASQFLKAGVSVFAPIAHSYAIGKEAGLPLDDNSFWLKHDEPLMEAAQGLVVVHLAGWDDSAGIKHEIAFFTIAGKPVRHWRPGTPIPEVCHEQ